LGAAAEAGATPREAQNLNDRHKKSEISSTLGFPSGLWHEGPWSRSDHDINPFCGRIPVERYLMAHRFTVIYEKEDEGGYHVFCPTLPGCHTQSDTIEEGDRNIREAIELYVDSLIEDGLPVPEEDILIKPIEIPA
jgi:predicted RNase H-like HicB family nuclease